MCIAVFLWKSHPLYPFLLFLNRDEFHNRPTTPLGWWDDGQILGGRDEQAGGTWLACTKQGKLAFLTNVREISSTSLVNSTSRGDLPIRFFKSSKNPKEFAEELVGEGKEYNGFNLIVADLNSMEMVYITNRPRESGMSVSEVVPGIHVLSNAKLDTPWPKALRLRNTFEVVINKGEISVKEIMETLMKDTTKDDDKSKLPQIYTPEFEYQLSAIFIDAQTAKGRYGTRSISAVALGTNGDVCFFEKNLEKDTWKERMTSYQIEEESTASTISPVSETKARNCDKLRDH